MELGELDIECFATAIHILNVAPFADPLQITFVLDKVYGDQDILRANWPTNSTTPNPMDGKKQTVEEFNAVLEGRKSESKWKHGVPKVFVKSWTKVRA